MLALALAFAPAAAWAVNGAGYTSGASFQLPRGARAVGLGGAYVAVASGADSVLWNPAGMDQLRDIQVAYNHLSYIEGVSDESVEIARPIYGLGAWGVGLNYLDTGVETSYDGSGNATGNLYPRDYSGQVALSLQLPDDLHVGVEYKLLREDYNQSAMGSAFDLGLQWLGILQALDMGFAIQNFGTPMALGSGYSSLGLTMKLGLALHLPQGWLLAVDEDFEPWTTPGSSQWSMWNYSYNLVHAGLEETDRFGDWAVSARAGYVLGPQQDAGGLAGLAVGGGVAYGHWQFDYAWTPMGDLGVAHRVSITYTNGD